MPDQNMPYYNDPGQQKQFGQNIPNPSQQMMDYSYLQNNQQIMYNGQSNVANTMRIAQDNFHRDMNNVLMGTMAAGMAIYNTGKSVVDKARERQYQDQLLGGGNYVLERGFMREAAWASGLAQTDFGRALKIGGRRPEFMSQGELEYQMGRSWHHRMEELQYEVGGGSVAAGSGLLGMGMTRGMGLLKGSLVGLAVDQTLGRFYDVAVAQPAEYRREFRKMTEVTDLNAGVGQRRLSGRTSDELAGRFYHSDEQDWARYIPIVGDAIANRLAPDTKAKEFMPKMMQAGLFRDQNLQDVDGMEKFVKDTIKVVEKFAALANTTKDAILGVKAKFNQMGFTDMQQNTMLGNIVTTSMSTGMDFSTVASYGGSFAGMGLQSGLSKTVVGQSGLTELASMKALQEAGFIDRGLDPGSLAINNTQRAIQYGRDGYGFVNRFSGNAGNPQTATATAAAYLATRGGGSTAAGATLMRYGMLSDVTDPNANLRKSAINMYEEFSKTKSPSEAYASVVAVLNPQTEEERAQIKTALFQGGMGEMLAAGSAARKEVERTGDKTKAIAFSLRDMNTLTNFDDQKVSFGVEKYYKAIQNNKVNNEEREKFQGFQSLFNNRIGKLYSAILKGDITQADKIKASIIDDATSGSGSGNNLSASSAEKAINMVLGDIEKSREGYGDEGFFGKLGRRHLGLDTKDDVLRKGGAGRLTLKDAVTDASNLGSDPRGFGKLTGYSDVSDKVYSAFEKLTKGKNVDSLKLLYQNMGNNKQENVAAFEEILNLEGNNLTPQEKKELQNYIHNDGTIGAGGKGLFTEYQKRKNEENKYGMRNSFLARGGKKDAGGNEINFDTYQSKAEKAREALNYLRSTSSKDAQAWLTENKGKNANELAYNLEIITGNKDFADAIVRSISNSADVSKNDPNSTDYKKFMAEGWFNSMDVSAISDEDKKKYGMSTDNSNTEAVKALTLACTRLADAIGK